MVEETLTVIMHTVPLYPNLWCVVPYRVWLGSDLATVTPAFCCSQGG